MFIKENNFLNQKLQLILYICVVFIILKRTLFCNRIHLNKVVIHFIIKSKYF